MRLGSGVVPAADQANLRRGVRDVRLPHPLQVLRCTDEQTELQISYALKGEKRGTGDIVKEKNYKKKSVKLKR